MTITFTDTLVTNSTTTSHLPADGAERAPHDCRERQRAHAGRVDLLFDLGHDHRSGQDTVTQWIVHWGDGQTSALPQGGLKSHVYQDGPAVAAITVDLVDEDGTFLNRGNPFSVIVDNVPPSIVLTGNAR